VGEELAVALRVGEHFLGEPVPRDDARIERFVLVGPEGEAPVGGSNGSDPAGLARVTAAGVHVIGYRSRRKPITLEPARFEAYLRDEGIESIVALRAERGESRRPGREVFSRCAKALVAAGEGAGVGFGRALGFTLEIIPLANPYALAAGGELPILVTHERAPIAGVLLVALSRDRPRAAIRVRTGADGRASVRLDRPGVWLLKAVHMVPAPPETGADWESLWASLTFELP
jgi:hypothetical protein